MRARGRDGQPAAMATPNSEPVLAGSLCKRGHINHTWKKRYFELHEEALIYFDQKGGKALGAVRVAAETTCAPSGHRPHGLCFRRAEIPPTGRGDAAAATWTFRGDGSRRRCGCRADSPRGRRAGEGTCAREERWTDSVGSSRLRRGCDVDIPWRWVAATLRLRQETPRGDAAAATWTIRGDAPRRRRGHDVDMPLSKARRGCDVETDARLRYVTTPKSRKVGRATMHVRWHSSVHLACENAAELERWTNAFYAVLHLRQAPELKSPAGCRVAWGDEGVKEAGARAAFAAALSAPDFDAELARARGPRL